MPETLNQSGRFTVAGYRGIAFYLEGYATEWTREDWEWIGGDDDDPDDVDNYIFCESEEIEDRSHVRAIMVGDDHVHIVDVDDLTEIHEDEYCHECGQVGCCVNVYRED